MNEIERPLPTERGEHAISNPLIRNRLTAQMLYEMSKSYAYPDLDELPTRRYLNVSWLSEIAILLY